MIFLNWAVMGMILGFSFTCNIRALLMKSELTKPIDTTEELYKEGLTANLIASSWYPPYLRTSSNEWHRKVS